MRQIVRLTGGAVVLTLLLGTFQSQALADPSPSVPRSGYVVVEQDGAGSVSIPAVSPETAVEKQKWLADHARASTLAETLVSSGSRTLPGGALNVIGATSVDIPCGLFSCAAKYSRNYGDFSWIGPGNVSQIHGSLKWWLSGVNITFNLPPGIGFSVISGGVLWEPSPVYNTWHEHLDYPGTVQLNATYISTAHFTAQADFLKGGTWYHVQGD